MIIDCGRYHNVYDPALIQDPASNRPFAEGGVLTSELRGNALQVAMLVNHEGLAGVVRYFRMQQSSTSSIADR